LDRFPTMPVATGFQGLTADGTGPNVWVKNQPLGIRIFSVWTVSSLFFHASLTVWYALSIPRSTHTHKTVRALYPHILGSEPTFSAGSLFMVQIGAVGCRSILFTFRPRMFPEELSSVD